MILIAAFLNDSFGILYCPCFDDVRRERLVMKKIEGVSKKGWRFPQDILRSLDREAPLVFDPDLLDQVVKDYAYFKKSGDNLILLGVEKDLAQLIPQLLLISDLEPKRLKGIVSSLQQRGDDILKCHSLNYFEKSRGLLDLLMLFLEVILQAPNFNALQSDNAKCKLYSD
ncbi:MAG: hypothetical protein UU65_C0002G0268 [candidate division CPR2 bacterium GW2011_GWC1_41_48]|uniref:Uncharacterized protein n=1 Tax=candidate division CPR2 bacterium GW2011_GWC1_41_48 TaxID=1618344 RepID=A0A0G0W929_UNCC2|nr:MAG: hypothetical protein UT47_C0002G0036 [candidate division CPR2 bacterium GW2011_GWC2_39_35]KKR27658.1 MAG: hypothetical protein UT59_C0049G0005 [candidate division CPR2 bacterium GW2011_GWD1_39_7]KKR28993.1 MAG: hypothetical protein UT60_C0008G0036 [candidate division CPR2 bacterium GW2011_GWD2_39_7]KKS09490.1 MAG: hypothetical protein UU65_C0002G0268 [candidate division CPR2 bacterium GW2011_GWC1_41_48]OGB59528.1 MAG: hypothetical protein A2Y27_01735 [candidate division CPR2 bacterium G